MAINFRKEKNDIFYNVEKSEIETAEKEMKLIIPKELKEFYLNIGYGFLEKSEFNINRIMDPLSVRDFRLRQNDFEFYPDIEIYDEFEEKKLIFFEANETALFSIEINSKEESKIYYYNTVIANSLAEFFKRIHENDEYYLELV